MKVFEMKSEASRQPICIAINCMQMTYRIATAQLKIIDKR